MADERPTPDVVARFREVARTERFPRRYSGWAHVLFTSSLSIGVMVLAASRLREVQALEWLTVPLTLAVANLGEYLGHRGPMHHPRPGLHKVYRRHTGEHHRFFTREAMFYEDSRDFFMVLFPPVLQIFFLGFIAAPLAALTFLIATANAGWLFVGTVMAYYYVYEILHFCHHLPTRGWMGRVPLLAALRRHHARHHDPRWMQRGNFNITFPICDWIFGTLLRDDDVGQGPPSTDKDIH